MERWASVSTEQGGTRERLIQAAMRLLEHDGPEALQARKVSAEIGASTMAVYTHFGGMPQLVEAIARTGYVHLSEQLAAVPRTDDPVADFLRLGLAYRTHARGNPQLYRLMFGLTAPGGYRLPEQDLTETGTPSSLPEGQTAFGHLVGALTRAIEAGRIRPGEPALIAAQAWSVIHGYVLLEIAGALGPADHGLEQVLMPLALNLLVGLGDTAEAAARSALTLQRSS